MPPTMLQTLSNLLNLYLVPDTDRAEVLSQIESDSHVFAAFLQTTSQSSLSNWHSELSTEDLGTISLALANQIVLEPLDQFRHDVDHPLLAEISRSLMSVLGPDHVRETELAARLAGTDIQLLEPHLNQALRYYQRPLETLHGTHLATRVLACAENLLSDDRDIQACAQLLSLDESVIQDLTRVTAPASAPSDSELYFSETLAKANLHATTARLAQQLNITACLQEVCATLFSTRQVSIYLHKNENWTNGTLTFDAPQSLIVSASLRGQPITTAAHTMTVLDDEALSTLGATDGIAIPILLEKDKQESCVAVVLLGLDTASLMTLASRQDLLDSFGQIAGQLFRVAPTQGIDIEDVDNRAREIIHEANNPLSTVQNYLKVLSLKLGPEHEAQPTIESISSELMRAANIIRSFRDIPETAARHHGTCDINKSLRDIAMLFEQGNHEINFHYQLSHQVHAAINTDDFKQIATNLIKNAVEELRPGNSITLATQSNLILQDKIWVEITFADSGPGIQTGVGDIFSRGVSTKSGDHAGEGLAVVKQLTEQHGGFVSYRTSQEGTEFRITLPQSQNRVSP